MVVFIGCGKMNPEEETAIRGYLKILQELGVRSFIVIQEPKSEDPFAASAARFGDFGYLLDSNTDFLSVSKFKDLTLDKIKNAIAKRIEDIIRKYD